MKRVLFVAGTWDENNGKPSGLIQQIINQLKDKVILTAYNGGHYNDLESIIETSREYDYVFWFANVDNTLPKVRDVKAVAPKVMLITSKRNDNEKYTFQDLIQRSLAAKANLTYEFSKVGDKLFNIRIFDPLGCLWYNGTDVTTAVEKTLQRLDFLSSITRRPTKQSQRLVEIPCCVEDFLPIIHEKADIFHKLIVPAKDVQRFLGNCSFRCTKSMPSFRCGEYIYVSQRNVDKNAINKEHFVAVYEEDNTLYYCGDHKPSVDTPIQVKLYQHLPNINYMIHSHCYIDGAPFTSVSIPCGGIEEIDEILKCIEENYKSKDCNFYIINLIGHGSILMSSDIEKMKNVKYIGRQMPEIVE